MNISSTSSIGQNSLANYQKIQCIGKGAYGQVSKAKDKKTKQIVAIKRIIHQMESEGLPSTSIRQISLLKQIDHQNVVRLKDVVVDKKQLYIVFQYLDSDLKTYLEALPETKLLDSFKVKKFLYQLLSGIADCHMKRIIHRDLKPANILLDKNENIKIADFGLARTFSVPVRPYSQEVVTLWYRAPQLLLGTYDYATPIDIWAIGCIFMEMITKKPLFPGDRQLDQLIRIFKLFGTPNQDVWPGVTQLRDYKTTFPKYPNNFSSIYQKLNLDSLGQDLLKRMLKYNPQQRITARSALQHPYFKDLKEKL